MSHGYLQSALVFLACAVIFVPIFHRLGLGSVLGYLIGGVAIGPWGLGLITNVEDIMHFSEFGVVLFLFLIGLELEPKRLWGLRVPIFGMGGAQVGLNTIAIAGVGLIGGLSWPAALIAGFGFSLSSTAIALQILKEKNQLQTTSGNYAFSILLFQDIAVIPMIAVLPLLAAQSGVASASAASGTLGFLKVIGVLLVVIFVGRQATRPLLRFMAGAHLREIFTAFALLLVIGMAALMQSLELSMGLGAFLAGVLLADSEYRHALETDIEPFKGLLLGLFFISVGMSIDLGAIARSPVLVMAIVLGVTLVKCVNHAILARAFKVAKEQIPFFSLVLSQIGEFAFVLFAAAKALGILRDEVAAPMIAATAISMLLSPLLVYIFDRLIAPRLGQAPEAEADSIEDIQPPVIIAGFGRFGQIIGRLLYANGIQATVLDHEPDQIELLRRFGFKVYFGDATREDLLTAAGAKTAKILVVAIDDVDDSLRLIDLAQKEFPHLKIYARARNVQHVYQLMDRNVDMFERETFEASLKLGVRVLQGLGWPAHPAWETGNHFRHHNIEMLRELHPIRSNQADMIAKAKQARIDLEKMFEREKTRLETLQSGWD